MPRKVVSASASENVPALTSQSLPSCLTVLKPLMFNTSFLPVTCSSSYELHFH